MESMTLTDFDQALPEKMPVSVIMEKKPSASPWIEFAYSVIGVVTGAHGEHQGVKRIHQQGDEERFLISGLSIQLYQDECESYYHNLMSPHPSCYVVASPVDDPNAMPVPFLVSLSFDEVHAYLEGDGLVFSVDIAPELYKWSEAYTLTHYVATKRTKRKRQDWKQQNPANGVNGDPAS